MTDYFDIYQNHAAEYDLLVEREDFEQRLLPAIEAILPLAGLDVIETGAGTGRLTCMLAPIVQSLRAFDASQVMLDVAVQKLRAIGLVNWQAQPADHRHLPVEPASADLVISGWSLVYLALESGDWQKELDQGLKEMERVLRPAGISIIIETLGTGQVTPLPPLNMVAYLTYLEEQGFERTWIRTDYLFSDMEEARRLVTFFFGAEMLDPLVQSGSGVILPECTGLWWKVYRSQEPEDRAIDT